MDSNNYEQYYNINILDDLHNYFPDILYSARGRFRTIDDLLDYIRQQTRNRFDLFSNARLNHVNRIVNTEPLRQSQPLTQEDDQIHITLTEETLPSTPTRPIRTQVYTLGGGTTTESAEVTMAASILNLLNTMYNPITTNTRSFMDPVVVRPTQEQITNATSIIELPNNSEICAICQENMLDSQQIQRINHCRHTFHNSCITRHFRTNVRCPICRYDIRTTTSTTTTTTTQ